MSRHLGTLDDVYDFDVLVIGSGPGGQKAAIAAAKLDRRVAIVNGRTCSAACA
jgi:NAD(P) transhydrogenase